MRLRGYSKIRSRQNGTVNLVIALLVFVSVTTMTLYFSRTALMEQRFSGNEYRAKQAFEAAEAGLQYAIGYLEMPGGADHDNDGVYDTNIQPGGTAYTISLLTDALGSDFAKVQSSGTSDDGTANHLIEAVFQVQNPIGGAPPYPLITKNVINVSGNATIKNLYTNANIWSGSDVTTWGSGGTFLSNGAGGEVQMSGKFGNTTSLGVDIIDQSSELANASIDEFFNNFFSGSKEYVRNIADIDSSDDPNFSPSDLALVTNSLIWVEGDIHLTSNTRIGCTASHPAVCSDDPSIVNPPNVNPVILVVNGNLTASGSVDIYGLVYVMGDWDVQGSFNIYGATIVEGNVSGNGTFNLVYEPGMLNATNWGPSATKVAGTWKDW